jgi:hypothetical protein
MIMPWVPNMQSVMYMANLLHYPLQEVLHASCTTRNSTKNLTQGDTPPHAVSPRPTSPCSCMLPLNPQFY